MKKVTVRFFQKISRISIKEFNWEVVVTSGFDRSCRCNAIIQIGLHSSTSNTLPIASIWVHGCWWTKWAAVEGKTLTIHFCNCATSLCKKHKRSYSRAMVCFWRNSVCTMWASSMGATTSSETVLAYLVTMSSNPWKKFLMTSTCLMKRPLSKCIMSLVGPNSCRMAPPTCNEGIRI